VIGELVEANNDTYVSRILVVLWIAPKVLLLLLFKIVIGVRFLYKKYLSLLSGTLLRLHWSDLYISKAYTEAKATKAKLVKGAVHVVPALEPSFSPSPSWSPS